MDQQNTSATPAALRWGLILGLVGIATTTINYALGGFNPENQDSALTKIIQYGMYAVIILILVLAMQQHRDNDLGGYMKYGRGLGLGTLIGVVYGVMAGITTFIIFKFFMPADYIDKMVEMAREKMLERNPNMPDDQIDQGLSIARKFMTPPMMSLWVLLGGVIICFIFSLIVSAFIKKNNPDEVI